MRRVDGYVCVVRTNLAFGLDTQLLFGEKVGQSSGEYENLTSNDLTVYGNKEKAEEGKEDLVKREDFSSVRLARLQMDVFDTDELDDIVDTESLVVVMSNDESGDTLLGPFVEGIPIVGRLPGAYICDTDFKTFDSLERAVYLGTEVNRQAESKAYIATFQLDFLE